MVIHNGHKAELEWRGLTGQPHTGYYCPVCGEYLSQQPGTRHGVVYAPDEGEKVYAEVAKDATTAHSVFDLTPDQVEFLIEEGVSCGHGKGFALYLLTPEQALQLPGLPERLVETFED